MREFFHTYPYLAGGLGGLAFLGIGLAVLPGQRKPALLSGALGMPFAGLGTWFVPVYWDPQMVWRVGRVGLEDLVFSFAFAAWAWLFAIWPVRKRATIHVRWRFLLAGYAGLVACALATFGLAYRVGRDPMASIWMAFAVGVAFHLFLRPEFWRLALAGGLGFGLAYGLYVKLLLEWFPAFAASWSVPGRWSTLAWGLPVGEWAWAVGYGACWPLFLAFVFRAEMKKEAA